MILLRTLPELPSHPWSEEIIVGRVRDVEHDIRHQPPTSIIHVIGRDGKGISGGFAAFKISDIVRVIGTMGATLPRQTEREERAEKRAKEREERMAARAQRLASRRRRKG